MRAKPNGKSWEESLRAFEKRAEALPEGSLERIEMETKARNLEYAIAFRAGFNGRQAVASDQT